MELQDRYRGGCNIEAAFVGSVGPGPRTVGTAELAHGRLLSVCHSAWVAADKE